MKKWIREIVIFILDKYGNFFAFYRGIEYTISRKKERMKHVNCIQKEAFIMKKRLKKITTVMLVVVLLLSTFSITPIKVQAGSLRKVTKLQAIYAKRVVSLSWKKAGGAKSYEVYRSTDGKKYRRIKKVTTNSWQDSNRAGEFWYKVRAVSGKKKGAFSSATSTYTIGGRIPFRKTGSSFIDAGTSIFPITLWNFGNKKPVFFGQKGKNITMWPIRVYNKQTGRVENAIFSDKNYYSGSLCNAGGENYLESSTLNKGKGNYTIYAAGLGMVSPYIDTYDNADIYTYYIKTYFKLGSRIYSLTVTSNPTYMEDYAVLREK